MLDFFHIPDSPNVDIQRFYGPATATLTQWQTWRKPRGCKMVHMIGVGGGSSGGCGLNSGTTSGGGAGGGSGAQTSLLIPAIFLPEILYIQAGNGGQQPATLVSAAVGVVGTITYVAFEPSSTLVAGMTVLFANPGAVTGTAATVTAGGAAGTAAAVATIANFPLGGKGQYSFFAGQAGGAGGSSTVAPTALALPTTGLMVTGGAGGGGTGGATALAGANITGVGLGGGLLPTVTGGTAGSGATPGGLGSSFIAQNFMMSYGGSGGGGGTATSGGNAGDGGNGSPGCGGGGAGGSTSTAGASTLARPGNGGPGFVQIISW